jgi:putative ABC transport system permease protein
VQPLAAYVVGDFGPVLWVTLAAVSLVLLIACANVANLLLARGEARGADLAVRTALGAARSRVIRMLLAESAILAGLGGALGILLSFGLVRLVVAAAPADFPRIREVAVDGSVLAYAVGATVVAALLAGLVPALRASRVDATASLRGATRAASGRRGSRLTLAVVGIEVTLAVVVTVGSGLMLRSLQRLSGVDTGLDTHGVVVLHPTPPGGRYPDGAAFQTYYSQVLERVRAVPGVESAGAIHLLPGTLGNWSFPTWPEGVDIPEGSAVPSVNFRVIWPGYFETVGMRPARGRLLEATDGADDEKVALVNQAFVDRFWPGQDAIGRTVRMFSSTGDAYRVVGVVGNVRQHGLAREPRPEMYFTHRQWGWNMSFWIVARVRGDAPLEHAAALKQAVWSVDRDVPVTGLDELARVFGSSAATTRFLALVLSSFGALALALGAIGVFGVTAFTVARRAPEFGVRVALGASRAGVLRTALTTCALPVGIGVVLGLAGAAAASRALRSVLFGVEPSDPVTFASVAATLVVAALFASLLPAWRASRVDPVRVLGSE